MNKQIELENILRIELLGDYESNNYPLSDYYPGEKFSNIKYIQREDIFKYKSIHHTLYATFDHEILKKMEGYRIYTQNNSLYDLSDEYYWDDLIDYMDDIESTNKFVDELLQDPKWIKLLKQPLKTIPRDTPEWNTKELTDKQKEWLDKNQIDNVYKLGRVMTQALDDWRSSPVGSKERKQAWTTYKHYCKKIFPKVNMDYYWQYHH